MWTVSYTHLQAKKKKVYHLHFMMTDNLTLSPKVLERYRRAWPHGSVFYKRFILGKWVEMCIRDRPLWRYDLQGAVYQEGVRLNTGEQLPFYLAVATKERVTDLDIFQITQPVLDIALREVEMNIQHFMRVKEGLEDPSCCGKCDYCKGIKGAKIRDYSELLEGIR